MDRTADREGWGKGRGLDGVVLTGQLCAFSSHGEESTVGEERLNCFPSTVASFVGWSGEISVIGPFPPLDLTGFNRNAQLPVPVL